jgi:hypothetical protein
MLNIRSFIKGYNQIFYFDFSLSDIERRGAIRDGVRITLEVSNFDENEQTLVPADLVARRRAESLLRSAIAELRKVPEAPFVSRAQKCSAAPRSQDAIGRLIRRVPK